MEQANNTWNKGLQMDTHPMMQGNDSMTDCLNGTLITMNGNEVILQNDMGNRRIDHAFLPSGYEPVGIKEHGGVIYVASYNPITNKSQIGSFPSPERSIDINDDNLKNSFDFDSFFKEKTSEGGNIQNDSTLNIPVMISDSFLIPLTPKNKLHVGDIFTVYSPHLSKLAPDLTNYDNIQYYSEWKECTKQEYDEITDSNLKKEDIIEQQSTYYKRSLLDKVYSPKNRKYTLQLGILNEQNNFNDITSSLVRWDSPLKEVTEKEYNEYKTTKEIRYYIYEDDIWKEVNQEKYNSFIGNKQRKYFIYVPQVIRNLENKSQLYKFNTGYFIPDGFLSDKDIDGKTIDDANLIKSRKQIAANNFSYKLAGPLYLKVSYNHVHSFGYAINGTWDGTTATLKITGYFTYNCPDGVNTINDNGDSDYYTFKTGEPTNIQFDFFDNNENKPAKIEPNATSTSTCIYNKTTNLYTVTQVKEYTIKNPGDIYNYVIGVYGGEYKVHQDPKDEKPFYIKDLSSIGQINLRLLNSGAITLKQYKFYNKAETHDTTMTLEFETYPKEGQTFEDMYLKFENINNQYDIRYLTLHQPILNGKQVFSFNWLDSISNDAEGTEYDEDVPYEQANIKLEARQTYKVTIHYKDVNTQLNQEINSTYDDRINRWLLTTELFNDLYSSNLTDYCNKALTDWNQLFQKKLTIAPNVNLDSLYKVQYSNVVFTPLYIVDDTKDANLTIKQTVSFIAKAASGTSLDVSDYPEYIGTPQLIIKGNDSSVELKETIEKNSYEPIIVYHPIRKIADYKDKILASFIGYAYSQDKSGDDYTKMIYFYKRSYEEYTLNQGGGRKPTILNENYLQNKGWNKGWEDKKQDGSIYKNITNLQDLADTSNIFSLCKGFYFPATFGINHGGSDVSEGDSFYIGGPFYAVNRNTNNDEDIAFVKKNPAESDLLINWNELQASEPVYKINGDEPTIKQFTETLQYDVQIEGANNNIPEYNNLIFKIDTEQHTKDQIVKYDNSQIVYEYKLYKNKTQDNYINMNTGYKITNTSYDQVDSQGVFKVENYSTLKYLKPTKFDKLARCRDDDESYVAEIRGYYSTNISNAKELNFVNTYPLTIYDPSTETDIPIQHPNIIGYTFSTDIQYKIDNGSWGNLPAGSEVKVGYNDPETPGGVKVKQIIYWRKNVIGSYDNNGVGTFTSKEYVYNEQSVAEAEIDKYEYHGNAGKFVAYDNILSIIYGENFEDKTAYINYAFKDLFKNCSGLTNASGISLQADLAIGCFQSMFENCTSITESPVLSASKFKNNCYSRMFNGCTNLSKVTCLASSPLNILYENATTDWLENVANSGEFIQKSGYSLWGTGDSGIPNGWTKTEV